MGGGRSGRIAQTYCAWRSGCPGWRSTHLDRRRSCLETAEEAPLWEALPFWGTDGEEQVFGPMYGGLDEDEE